LLSVTFIPGIELHSLIRFSNHPENTSAVLHASIFSIRGITAWDKD